MQQGNDDLLWWGYLHINNNVQVKRYFDKRDIEEAFVSDFVNKVTDNPFPAKNREEALKICKELLK